MGHDHTHVPKGMHHERPLWWALGLTASVLVAEIIGAVLTRSLALLSDALHMATDVFALMIALVAVRLSRRPPDVRRTYGYARLEALGALVNGVLLFGVGGYILWEAVQRLRAPQEIVSSGMLVIAVLGLVINLIVMRLLHAGRGENLSMKGAYLEVWSDMLGSVAVIVAAMVIYVTRWYWVDSVLAALIGLWVLPRTWLLLSEAVNVLLEGVPKGFALPPIRDALSDHPGVANVHDVHLWALGSRQPLLTAHVVAIQGTAPDALRRTLQELLHERFSIEHVTLQIEIEHCGSDACDAKRS
ncbi:cation diffusion facilitator family transporter [Xylella fastidiosa]|uniref:cation diffusion facilitator family transporter n=1 Tax=Xylella fastidiosa TaxID=2371 RepID=UPI000707625F|nr:cation diffusion facilitator family transporter [Xylella fastidiosa]KQH74955.1 cation diffusion facilitator family transporter [Xylella fastidiosa]WNY18829.1 cation diffusion facilitator family transporter [Xylella fastidiosa]WNY21115.1 cation diffusion facilitator family transporter [Xylella fastidiosa]